MAEAKFEEVVRLAFETGGTEDIKQAAAMLANMGDVSEAARAQAAGLLDTLSQTGKTERAVEQYRQIGLGVMDYQRQITTAKAKVIELAEALKQTDAPSKAQQRELEKARSAVSGLVAAQQKQLVQLRDLKGNLEGQGIGLRSIGSAQQQVAARTAEASAKLRTMVGDLRATRASEASFQSELASASAKSKAEVEQYQAALKRTQAQIKANAETARVASTQTDAGLSATRGLVDKLKGAFAGVAAVFSVQGIVGGIKSILSTGDQFDRFQKQLTSLYHNADKGAEAFAWAKQFAKDTPLQLDQVMRAFIQLKNFGIDPMSGALQAAVDQNAKLGGESERLERITLAMGQAFAKGRLQGDDIKQMIEAGVPVWQLLAEVTGKTTAELQQMSAAGKLGTDVMRKFFAQMGKDSAGAAAEQMNTLSGQWSNLLDNLQQFEDRVAQKGVMGWVRDQLSKLNQAIGSMDSDGRLDKYAQRISDGMVAVGSALKSATGFLIEHAGAIAAVARTYAVFKVARIGAELGIAASRFVEVSQAARMADGALAGAGKRAGMLSTALRRIPGGIRIAIAVVGFDLLQRAGKAMGEFAGQHSAAAKAVEQARERISAQLEKQAEMYMQVEQRYARFADTQVLGAAEVAKLSAAERESYAERLAGLREYLSAKASEQLRLHELGRASQDELDKTRASYKAAREGAEQLAQGVELAAQALRSKLSPGAQEVRNGLAGIAADATTAATRVETLFQSFQSDSITHIGDVALALANVAGESQAADRAVRVGLQGTLAQLSSTDLLKFQSSATAAFAQYGVSAQAAASVTETVLQVALERLGVSADRWGLRSTEAAQQNVAAFQTVAENASSTAATIEAAFDKAVANATTVESVRDLGTAMQAAGQQGRIGFDGVERSAALVQDRLRQLQTALDPLNNAFERLGIRSKRSLDDAAAAARSSFNAISAAYRNGGAAIEDVRAAFAAYARTQLDAVANADDWQQSSVRSALQVQAATLNVSDEMARMGLTGLDAGQKVVQGAHAATEALGQTAQAADAAATSTKDYGDAAEKAGDDANAAQRKFNPAAVALNGLSDSMLKHLEALNAYAGSPQMWGNMWNSVFAEWQRQKDQFGEQMAMIEKQNAAYDEMAKRVDKLRDTYGYLSDDALRAMAQAQKTLEDNQRRAKEEADAKLREAAQARADKAKADTDKWRKSMGMDSADEGGWMGRAAPAPAPIKIDLSVASSQAPGAVPAQLGAADVQKIANEVVRQIGISRARSNR